MKSSNSQKCESLVWCICVRVCVRVCACTSLLTGQSSQKRHYSFYFRTQNTIMTLICQKQNICHVFVHFCFFLTSILFFGEVRRFLRTTAVRKYRTKCKSHKTNPKDTMRCRSHNISARKKIFQQQSIHQCRKYSY